MLLRGKDLHKDLSSAPLIVPGETYQAKSPQLRTTMQHAKFGVNGAECRAETNI